MATTSFKRKKYGMVTEVKRRKAKAKRPDVRELARYYKAIAKNGVWQQLDNVCYAMNWWEHMLQWFHATTPKEYMTTDQAKTITIALKHRAAAADKGTDDTDKIVTFCAAIRVFEKLASSCDLKVPAIQKAIDEGKKNAKKHKGILDKLAPKHEKHTSLLNKMFPSCTLEFVVVPRIIDPMTGKDIGRKMDHTKNKFYYSREMMKALRHVLRSRGLLALAVEEAWWLSRAMSFRILGKSKSGMLLPNPEKHLELYRKMLEDFEVWARRKDTPARLAKKPAKPKKIKEDPQVPDDGTPAFLDEEELKLLNDPIVSVEEIHDES